ncbi:MAG: hypothetical protein K6G47_02480 [Clostridia bacterium]|nr:hypothetical protein [Clostridia bacterium]
MSILLYKFFSFLQTLNTSGRIVLGALLIILGIVVVLVKDKATKNLGFWTLISGINGVLSGTLGILRIRGSAEILARASSLFTVLGMLLTTAAYVFLFLYAKARYSAKGLLPVILIKLAGFPVTMILNIIMNPLVLSDKINLYLFLSCITTTIFDIAVLIILTRIYIKNRSREEHLPMLWLVPLIQVIGFLFEIMVSLIVVILPSSSGVCDVMSLISIVIVMAVVPVFAVYILIKAPQSSKTLDD